MHPQAFVVAGFVVVLDPGRELVEDGGGIGSGVDAGEVALERLHAGLVYSVAFGTAVGVKQATRFSATAKSRVA